MPHTKEVLREILISKVEENRYNPALGAKGPFSNLGGNVPESKPALCLCPLLRHLVILTSDSS